MQIPETIVNFRDLGGMSGADGRLIAKGRLLRSGQLVGIAGEDKSLLLDQYRLRCVLDLRSASEQEEAPDDTFGSVSYYAIDVMKNAAAYLPDRNHFSAIASPAAAEEFMRLTYALAVRDDASREGYRTMIDILAALEDGAALFHCYAGKDRTGIAAAIILTLLGVQKQDILADYLKTNEQRQTANEQYMALAAQQGADESRLAAIQVVMGVQESFLESAYTAAQEMYGSFEAFTRQGLGVDDQTVECLRTLYLE